MSFAVVVDTIPQNAPHCKTIFTFFFLFVIKHKNLAKNSHRMWKTNRTSTTTRGWGSALLPTQKVVLDKNCHCCYTVVKQKDLIFGKASPHPTHLDFLAEKSEQGVRKRYSVDHLSKQRGAGWQTGSLLFPKENNKTDPDQSSRPAKKSTKTANFASLPLDFSFLYDIIGNR